MEPTRRVWLVVAIAGAGLVLAAMFSNPLLLGVPVGVGTWILAHQLAFVRSLTQIQQSDPPIIAQSLSDTGVYAGDFTALHVQFAHESETMMGIDAALKVTLPSALVDDTAHLDRQPEADNTEFTMPIQARVAGEFEIQPQPVSLTSGHGLFVETMRVGNSCTLTVEPRLSKETQLGSDDAQIGVIHGEHDALVGASRDEHGTVRAYTPSDPMNGIDWSVTARLGEPHVRDRDPQTVRRTRVYIDRRRPMHEGAPGETKLDYAREIGLLLTTQAADNDDPLCVTLVDDRGDGESEHGRVTEASRTTSGAAYYQRVRRTLHDLTPDNDKPTDEEIIEDTTRHFRTTTATRSDPLSVRRDAVRRSRALGHADTFARTLAPYFEEVTSDIDQMNDDELFSSVDASIREHGTNPWIAIVTDDSNHRELLSIAALAESHGVDLSMFLVPSTRVAGDGGDASATAGRCRTVQWLVRELREHDGVRVCEVNPCERSPENDSRRMRSTQQ
jgi:uncharacterized protein (DUF58 family)